MDQKTHWKKLHNPNYLGAYALQPGEDLVAVISKVRQETVMGADGKKDECTVVYFSEPKDTKPMILNVTNARTIERLLKTPYIEEWEGHAIQIYMESVSAFGNTVDALRIRARLPVLNKPELNPDSDRWPGAVQSISEGKIDITGIRKHFSLSADNEALLIEQTRKGA